MGLENLKSVFNDLNENINSPIKGRHGKGLHLEDHSSIDDIENNPISDPNPSAGMLHGILTEGDQYVFKLPEPPDKKPLTGRDTSDYNDILKHSTIDPVKGLYSPVSDLSEDSANFGQHAPFTKIDSVFANRSIRLGSGESLIDEEIKHTFGSIGNYEDDEARRDKLSFEFGKNINLGEGKLVRKTLYDKSHKANTNRVTFKVGNQTINTGRAGMGSFKYMDIKANGGGFRQGWPFLGFGDGREPYIVNEIGSKVNSIGNNRDLIPLQASLEDMSRLGKFYTSTAGIAFMAKENITNIAIGDGVKLTEPGGFIMAPPFPMPGWGNTGFLNYFNQSFQGAGRGSIRKPFKIQYSKRASGGLPFNNLGDRPLKIFQTVLDNALDTEYPDYIPDRAKKELDNLKIRATMEIMEAAQNPLIGRPTPFIDLSSGPKETDYIDRVSLQPVVSTESDKDIAPEEKGDFYVKIKDLRNKTFIYFRGYVTGITENVNPSWSPTNYIGRSEPTYMYERAERDLSFNLRVYPANDTEFRLMYDKIEKLTSLAYPEYRPDSGQPTLTRMKPPFTELYMAHIGNRNKGQFGFIKSLTYTVNETGDWDALSGLPRLFDISITYQILSKRPPSLRGDHKFYKYKIAE